MIDEIVKLKSSTTAGKVNSLLSTFLSFEAGGHYSLLILLGLLK